MAQTSKTERCAVDGCDKFRRNRGWCSAHYERWRKYGDVGFNKFGTAEERFWSKVDTSAGPRQLLALDRRTASRNRLRRV